MTIEGVPSEWELVRIGAVNPGETLLNDDGKPQVFESNKVSVCRNYPIIRLIEKPKTYRPFANAEEFKPHRERWVRRSSLAATGQ